MKHRIPATTKSSVASEDGLEPVPLPVGDIVDGLPPVVAHARPWVRWMVHARQWHLPLLSVRPAEKHVLKSDDPKSLAHSPASPEPELPLDCGV